MRSFSFRLKLILATSLVVIGVTGAVLYVTQRSVKAAYWKLFEAQFQAQLKYFSDSRLKQLDAVARQCETIAQSPELVSAMQSGDAARIFEIVLGDVREFYKPQGTPGPMPPPSGGGKPAERPEVPRRRTSGSTETFPRFLSPPFIRVVDAKGAPILPPSFQEFQAKKALGGNKKQDQFRLFANRAPDQSLKEQEIGYLATGGENQPASLREFIVSPIFGSDHGAALGALMLGFPVQDFGERTMFAFSDKSLCSGIWLDGKIYSETIPEAAREEIAARVTDEIKDSHAAGNTPVMIGGVPYRIVSKVLNPDSIFPPAAQVSLYSLAEYVREQDSLRQLGIEIGSASLLIGIGLILLISRGLSRPVEDLSRAARRIGHGDFAVRVPVRSNDEVGALATAFNEMAEGLSQKEKYKSVLGRVADPQIAEKLVRGEIALGGERKWVTILFCDIRGFAALTERMPPEEVIALLNEHMTAMSRIVHEHCGMVDKFVGDMIMALFGAPSGSKEDAEHAARCALAMLEERRLLNAASRHQIEIGIGLATGDVVAGCLGAPERMSYTVLGERVNLAARLCSHARSMEILMDSATQAILPSEAKTVATAPLRFKGFSEAVCAFQLEGFHESGALELSEEALESTHSPLPCSKKAEAV